MLDDLRALVESADAGPIAGAADRLFRTPSAITPRRLPKCLAPHPRISWCPELPIHGCSSTGRIPGCNRFPLPAIYELDVAAVLLPEGKTAPPPLLTNIIASDRMEIVQGAAGNYDQKDVVLVTHSANGS